MPFHTEGGAATRRYIVDGPPESEHAPAASTPETAFRAQRLNVRSETMFHSRFLHSVAWPILQNDKRKHLTRESIGECGVHSAPRDGADKNCRKRGTFFVARQMLSITFTQLDFLLSWA